MKIGNISMFEGEKKKFFLILKLEEQFALRARSLVENLVGKFFVVVVKGMKIKGGSRES